MINKSNTSLLLFFVAFSVQISFSQKVATDLSTTNIEVLNTLATEWEATFLQKRQKAMQKANLTNWPIRGEFKDGTVYEIVDFEGDMPEYRITYNLGAAISTSTSPLHPGGSTDYNLAGAGMIVGEWDGGATRLSHQEFGGRAIQRDGASTLSSHATHVAGTLIGGGVRAEAKGMAPEATLWAHDWNNDDAEMASAAAQGLLISNHSYGSVTGWARGDWATDGVTEWHWWGDVRIDEEEDYKFGWYNQAARNWDIIAANAPYYLIVKSAGNDRSDGGANNHQVSINGQWELSEDSRQRDGGPDGYDCLPTNGNAKNILTVGAVSKISGGWSSPSSVNMSSFSGWGPTDDGRIKPDIVGAGIGLLSSNSSADNGYNSSSGTSMSGPNVAGSLILLQELHQQLFGEFMWAATLKGLAIHTADEAGTAEGPDYRFGWGMLNTRKAADLLADPLRNQLVESRLNNNDTYRQSIYSDGLQPMKVTISWTDPAAQSSPAILNDRTPKLVNDLDIRIVSVADETEIYFPYILDPANPGLPAERGDNFLDNVEVIYPGVLPKGEYVLQVTHKGSLQGGGQNFSLIISAPIASCLLAVEDDIRLELLCSDHIADSVLIAPGLEADQFTFRLSNTEFQDSNIFYELDPGNYIAFIRDSSGCLGTQKIFIESPDPIQVQLEETFVFSTSTDDTFDDNLPFSSAFQASGWGGDPTEVFINARLVVVDDGSNLPQLGCNPLINVEALNGNIALMRRGECEFGLKALRAQQAGASAVIIINNEPGTIAMGAGASGSSVNIPVFMVSNQEGDNLIAQLEVAEDLPFTIGQYVPLRMETCEGRADGFAGPIVLGGVGPYTYLWSNGNQQLTLEDVPSGNYTLSITDANDCETSWSLDIPRAASPQPNLNIRNESCAGESDGMIRILNTSLLNQFDVMFSNGSIGSTASDLTPGTYELLFRSTDGCEHTREVSIAPGADISEPIIYGPTEVLHLGSFFFSTKTLDDVSFDWSVEGGEILSGQGTDLVEVLFDETTLEPVLTLMVTQLECTKSESKVLDAISTSSRDLERETPFKTFPNPTSNSVFVEFGRELLPQDQYPIEVLNINGQVLIKAPFQYKQEINLRNLAPGLYMIKSGPYSDKLIKL